MNEYADLSLIKENQALFKRRDEFSCDLIDPAAIFCFDPGFEINRFLCFHEKTAFYLSWI